MNFLVGILLVCLLGALVYVWQLRGRVEASENNLRVVKMANQQLSSQLEQTKGESEVALQKEQQRIASDLHDTISQSLFGIAFTLNGCEKLLPEQPEVVKGELQMLAQEAQNTRSDLRHVIFDLWPDKLTSEQFSADLQRYIEGLIEHPPELELDIRGDFAPLSPFTRRSLYRICQESLNNIAKHANAEHARVCLDIVDGRTRLLVRDDGRGFEVTGMMGKEPEDNTFGLNGMAKRTHVLGGSFDVFSRPDAGTSIVVDIPTP